MYNRILGLKPNYRLQKSGLCKEISDFHIYDKKTDMIFNTHFDAEYWLKNRNDFGDLIAYSNYAVREETYGVGNGYVGSNPKYRIQLSLYEARELKFWDYYFNENKPVACLWKILHP